MPQWHTVHTKFRKNQPLRATAEIAGQAHTHTTRWPLHFATTVHLSRFELFTKNSDYLPKQVNWLSSVKVLFCPVLSDTALRCLKVPRRCSLVLCKSSIKIRVGVEHWQNVTEGENRSTWGGGGERVSQCQFVHHKPHTDWTRNRTWGCALWGRRLIAFLLFSVFYP